MLYICINPNVKNYASTKQNIFVKAHSKYNAKDHELQFFHKECLYNIAVM